MIFKGVIFNTSCKCQKHLKLKIIFIFLIPYIWPFKVVPFCHENATHHSLLTQFWQSCGKFCVSQEHIKHGRCFMVRASVCLFVQFWCCLFLFFFPSSQPEGNVMHPILCIQNLKQKRSPMHVRCSGASKYKIKPAAHESSKLKYKTQWGNFGGEKMESHNIYAHKTSVKL